MNWMYNLGSFMKLNPDEQLCKIISDLHRHRLWTAESFHQIVAGLKQIEGIEDAS